MESNTYDLPLPVASQLNCLLWSNSAYFESLWKWKIFSAWIISKLRWSFAFAWGLLVQWDSNPTKPCKCSILMQMLNQLSYEANRSISRVPQGSRINFRCFPLFSCYKNALSLFGKHLVAFSVYLVHLSVNFPVDFDSRCLYREWLENWKHDCMPPSTSTCLKFDQ